MAYCTSAGPELIPVSRHWHQHKMGPTNNPLAPCAALRCLVVLNKTTKTLRHVSRYCSLDSNRRPRECCANMLDDGTVVRLS
jgi:hypothetical protein